MPEGTKSINVTEEGLKKLQDELNYLLSVRRPEVSKNIGIARGYGDLSENSEYDEAKNEQAKGEAQIANLEETLKHVQLVTDTPKSGINIGSKVVVRNLDTDEEETYLLVGSNEADALDNKISDQGPFGRAMIGAKVGDKLEIPIPAGTLRIQIVSVEK